MLQTDVSGQQAHEAAAALQATSMVGGKRVVPMQVTITYSDEDERYKGLPLSFSVAAPIHKIQASKVAWASEDDSEGGFPAVDLEKEVERKRSSPGGPTTYDVQLRKLRMQVRSPPFALQASAPSPLGPALARRDWAARGWLTPRRACCVGTQVSRIKGSRAEADKENKANKDNSAKVATPPSKSSPRSRATVVKAKSAARWREEAETSIEIAEEMRRL